MPSRLSNIVDFAYDRLRDKINGGRTVVANEASLQLQLSAILKTVGELFETHANERFSIELEKPVYLDIGFKKSGTSKAKIDIFLALENTTTREKECCAIELKFFKRENHREPNNRYDIFKDIQNLEVYGADVGYLIVATDHPHYVNQDRYSPDTGGFDVRHDHRYEVGTELIYQTEKPYGPPIRLRNSYHFLWHEFAGGSHFLKLEVLPEPNAMSPVLGAQLPPAPKRKEADRPVRESQMC